MKISYEEQLYREALHCFQSCRFFCVPESFPVALTLYSKLKFPGYEVWFSWLPSAAVLLPYTLTGPQSPALKPLLPKVGIQLAVEIQISQSCKAAVAQHLSKLLQRVQKTAVFKGNSTAFKGNWKSSAFKNDHSKRNVRASCGLESAGSPRRCQWGGTFPPSRLPRQLGGGKVEEPRRSREWGWGGVRAPAAPAGCSAALPRAGRASAPPRSASIPAPEDPLRTSHTRHRGQKFGAVLLPLTSPAPAASPRLCRQGPWAPASLCAEGSRAERLTCRAAKHCRSGLVWGFFPPASFNPWAGGRHGCCGFFLFYLRMRCWLKIEEMALEELMQRLNAVSQCAGRRSCWS